MLRRLTLLAALLAALIAAPLTATASIVPDDSYGDAGQAAVVSDCSGNTLQRLNSYVGYAGRVWVLERCGSGYHRVIAVDNDGEIDTGFGTAGRITVKIPTACLKEEPQLVLGKDGSAYLLAWGLSSHDDYQVQTDMHLCITRITTTGKLAPLYGGSSPVRRLDRVGQDFHTLVGGAVDDSGRLVVFSQRDTSIWERRAAFINRYTVAGKPDRTFSGDGQRAYTQPMQERFEWGGVIDNRPVIAISSHYSGFDGPLGTAFVRFSSGGGMDSTFSSDGKVYVKSTDIAGGHTGAGRIVVDNQKRITYIVQSRQPYEGSKWLDLRRIGPTGANDAAFANATAKILAPYKTTLPEPRLKLSTSHYIVNWEIDPPGNDGSYTTGFNANGTRWTALGSNGTVNGALPPFAPDRSAVYFISYYGSEGPDEVHINRSLVQ